jgi:hypothetical protein
LANATSSTEHCDFGVLESGECCQLPCFVDLRDRFGVVLPVWRMQRTSVSAPARTSVELRATWSRFYSGGWKRSERDTDCQGHRLMERCVQLCGIGAPNLEARAPGSQGRVKVSPIPPNLELPCLRTNSDITSFCCGVCFKFFSHK